MAYDDIFQPGIYKSWTEAIIKEKKIRMKWHEDYEAKQKQLSSEAEIQADKVELPCTCSETQQDSERDTNVDWPRKGATGTNTLLRVLDTPSSMVYPTPLVRSILYEGISHDGEGRAQYLKRRWLSDPEQRYHSQVCTNWMYGWNHGKGNELCCKDLKNCDIKKMAFGFK